jgi:hypothetical protein
VERSRPPPGIAVWLLSTSYGVDNPENDSGQAILAWDKVIFPPPGSVCGQKKRAVIFSVENNCSRSIYSVMGLVIYLENWNCYL